MTRPRPAYWLRLDPCELPRSHPLPLRVQPVVSRGPVDPLLFVKIRHVHRLAGHRFRGLQRQMDCGRADIVWQTHPFVDLGIVVVVGLGQDPTGTQNIHRYAVLFYVYGDGLAEAFQGILNLVPLLAAAIPLEWSSQGVSFQFPLRGVSYRWKGPPSLFQGKAFSTTFDISSILLLRTTYRLVTKR